MTQQPTTILKKISLVLKTVAARSMLIGYGILAVWRVTVTTGNESYWFLLMTLVPLVMELMYIFVYRNFKPFKWINPEVVSYLLCVIPCIWITELTLLEQSNESGMTDGLRNQQHTISTTISSGNTNNKTTDDFGEFKVEDFNWTLTMEQILIFALVLEKWIAPRGSKSLDELSQLLLLYIGSGVDILELFALFEVHIIRSSRVFVYLVLTLFSLSLIQFTVVLTATRKLPLPKSQLDELVKVVDYLKFTEKTSTKSKVAMWLDIVQYREKVNFSRQSVRSSVRSSPKRVIDTIIEAEHRDSLTSEPHYILFEDEPPSVDINRRNSETMSASDSHTEYKMPHSIPSVQGESGLKPFAENVSTSKNRSNKTISFNSNVASKERSTLSKFLFRITNFINRMVASDIEEESYSDAIGFSSDECYLDALDVKDDDKSTKRDLKVKPKFMSLQEADFYLKKLNRIEKTIETSTADASSRGHTSAGSKSTDGNSENNFKLTSKRGIKKKTKKRSKKKKKGKSEREFFSYARNKCNLFCFYNEMWSIIIQLLVQDVPFLFLRIFILLYYHILTRFMILFTFKNFITTVLSLRRIKAIYAEDKKPWLELMKYTKSSKGKLVDKSEKINK